MVRKFKEGCRVVVNDKVKKNVHPDYIGQHGVVLEHDLSHKSPSYNVLCDNGLSCWFYARELDKA